MASIYVDTVDMATLGLHVRGLTGHRDEPRKRWPTVNRPGSVEGAAVVVSTQPNYEPRLVEVFGHVESTADPRTHADLLANRAALAAAISDPATIDFTLPDDLTTKLVARCERFECSDVGRWWQGQVVLDVRMQLVCHDPRWVAV